MKREEAFDEDYLYFYETFLTDELSDAQADLIWRLLELEPEMDVLDLACGHGRIANRLAACGARVCGLDATAPFLELARADAASRGVEVEYAEGDMRALPWEGRFDRVISWFTSFGYFDDHEDRRVLAEAHRALRPDGRLLIETINLVNLLPHLGPSTVRERDGDFMIDRSKFDPVSGRATTDRVLIRDGHVRRFSYSVRMFVAAELRDWLLAAGFRNVDFYDGKGEPLTAQSRRMITIARR